MWTLPTSSGFMVGTYGMVSARGERFDIAQGGPAPIASEALERIAALYAIEKTIRGRSAGERQTVRQEKSKPLVLALKAWLEQQLTRVSGKATIAEDIRYALNHWDGLTRFLDDGRKVRFAKRSGEILDA